MRHTVGSAARWSTDSFRAMGSSCSIDTLGGGLHTLNRQGREQINNLERLWSRFLPTSEVSLVNANPERPTKVSAQTIELALFALSAWSHSSGAFCPFLGALMNREGYNETFEIINARTYKSDRATRVLELAHPPIGSLSRTFSPLVIDEVAGTLCIERGYELDFGGVAKGYAADVVAEVLIEAGAKAVLVDLGGDVSCRTVDEQETIWTIEAEGPRCAEGSNALSMGSIATIELRNGGVATSSTRRRTWIMANGEQTHHLMNPQIQASASSGVLLCSVAADCCAHAEVLTKMVVCGGADVCTDIVKRFVPDVLAVLDSGVVLDFGSWIRT